jgi:hypothetical protein
MPKKTFSVEIKVMPLKDLVHSDDNPRLIKPKENEELKQSLTDFPEMKEIREIIIDENNIIIGGDKRAYALEDIGYTDVKVKQVFGLNDRQKREFMAKDNVHNGEWDSDILLAKWDKTELDDWGVPSFEEPDGKDKKTKDVRSHDVTCPNCGEEFDPKEARAE